MWSQTFRFTMGYDKKSCTEDFWVLVLNAKMRKAFFDSICFFKKWKFCLGVIISGSAKDFWSTKNETFILHYFFQNFWWCRDDIVRNISITAQIFIDIQNTPDSCSSATFLESQLLYCYHVLQSFFQSQNQL